MPDLTLEGYSECVTATEWQTTIGKYDVTLSAANPGQCQVNWACSCPAFKFRPGDCKHIKVAQESHCGWMEFTDGGKAKDGCCPECGREAKGRLWGV